MSNEYIGPVCISDYLQLIREQEYESILLIAIVDDKVQETFIKSTKSKTEIDWKTLEGCGYFDFIKKWRDKGAKIYNYHNHPDEKKARPSIKDILNVPSRIEIPDDIEIPTWFVLHQCNAQDEFEVHVGGGFVFDDIGIVTQEDFFSMQQNPKQTLQILRDNITLYKKKNQDKIHYL